MKWIIAALLVAFGSAPVLAWGDQGHSLTCQIAYDLMTEKTKRAVDSLLQKQDARYQNFPNACTYPDDVKATDGRREQHYVNLHRDDPPLSGLACPVASSPTDCLLAAIRQDYDIVRDASASDARRSLALLYLGHWIGDLHQPLHISFKDDIGGGGIHTSGLCGGSNLHSIWDTCIIVQRIYATRPRVRMIDDPRFLEVSAKLARTIEPAQKMAMEAGEPWQWANESYEIARRPDVEYCRLGNGECKSVRRRGNLLLGDGYAAHFAPVVEGRLQAGGVRLAWLLNRVFDPAS